MFQLRIIKTFLSISAPRKERKKKKKVAKIVSFDDDLSSYSASPASSVASPLSKSSSFDLGSPTVSNITGMVKFIQFGGLKSLTSLRLTLYVYKSKKSYQM